MFNLGVYKKVLHFKTFLTSKNPQRLAMPLVIFPPRDRIISMWWGKCTVYIFALQHVPRMFEHLGALGMVQETKVIKLVLGRGS